jgi:pyrroloquinoline quinone biosynthesis protein B
VIVRVLGSAAGGGLPQWNCACANCAAARSGRIARRTQSSLAISIDGERWLLLNCSPDVGTQIEAFAPLQPRQARGTPILGMLFTDANVDHLGGLATLRQGGGSGFIVRSSALVREIATAQPAFAPFIASPHRWVEAPLDRACASEGDADLVGRELTVRALCVPGVTPGYDGRRRLAGAIVAYEISEHGGDDRLLFAPVFASIDDGLMRAISSATVAFVDGSFYSDDELIAEGLLPKRARDLGHQPVGGREGSLARLRGTRARLIFTHVNNSNPMLDPQSEASGCVRGAGAEIAYDGMELTL